MTAQATARVSDPPERGLPGDDAATIIRELGGRLIDAYNTAYAEAGMHDSSAKTNLWGSKQREQLLRALIEQVARHAQAFQNAALSATDAALVAFAREAFAKGATRSARDRAPIARNVEKVVGSWLRRLGRRMRQDTVTVSIAGDVALRTGSRKFRLSLTFAYPRRIVTDRRLRITAAIEELVPGVGPSKVPFSSDASAPTVALPAGRQGYSPVEARAIRDMFVSMKSLADMVDDPELIAYAEKGLRTFVPVSIAKVVLVLALSLGVATVATPAGRRVIARVVDAIRSSGSLRELLERLRVDPDDAVFVTPSGTRSQTAASGRGSTVRLSPGVSADLLFVQSFITDHDQSDAMNQIVPLGQLGRVGLNALQFRSRPHAPIMPWIIEVVVIPEQDAALAAELARRAARIAISYDPPLGPALVAGAQQLSVGSARTDVGYELRELPHAPQTYSVTATITREDGRSEKHHARLHADENGFVRLERSAAKAPTPVMQDVRVGHPICTTIFRPNIVPKPFFRERDYVWAFAHARAEQEVTLAVFPPSTAPGSGRATIEWGDGSKASHEPNHGLVMGNHRYRLGERAYPITVYFEGSPVVYRFDLYVFANRAGRADTTTLEYPTPYPPNPELTDLAQAENDAADGTSVLTRNGPVSKDSITYSRHADATVWKVNLPRFKPSAHVKVRYVWRSGVEIHLPDERSAKPLAPSGGQTP